MTQAALALVLLSAMAHAAWNFLLKRAINQEDRAVIGIIGVAVRHRIL